jgi:putative hydroxymethylpyrimidine transport system substrate-binding protein
VGIGAVVQRPLAAVIARRGIARPRQLDGKRVGVTGLPSDDAVLHAVVDGDGGDFASVRRTTIGFSAVPSLIAGKVDAVVTFWNAEGVTLRRRGFRTREFRVDDFGAPRYPELVVVTRRGTLRRHRELARDLVAALRAGTEYALDHRDAAVREIADVSDARVALVRDQFAAIAPALRPPLELRKDSLRGWARFDQRFGILRRRPDVERAFALDLG